MTAKPNLVPLPYTSDRGAYVELRQLLPRQIKALLPSIDQIMDFIAKLRNVDGSEVEIEVALCEALANAIVHGNREESRKHVWVLCRCAYTRTGSRSQFRMRDKGLKTIQCPTPPPPENRLSMSGRGIYLMRALMDDFQFEQRGTVVRMRQRFKAQSGEKGETT